MCRCILVRIILQGIRAQIDRDMYKKNMQDVVSSTPGLEMMEDSVEDIMLQPSSSCQRVAGVHLGMYVTCIDTLKKNNWKNLFFKMKGDVGMT